MWALGSKAAKYSKPPSEFIPGLVDELACYQFDNAVLWFCSTVENALAETEQIGVGDKVEHKAKYTLEQLLSDDFRLPRPLSHQEQRSQTGQQVKALFGTGAKRGNRRGKDKPKVPPLLQTWLQRHMGKAV